MGVNFYNSRSFLCRKCLDSVRMRIVSNETVVLRRLEIDTQE